MPTRVAINGLGRIGRCVMRAAQLRTVDIEIVAVNDVTEPATLRGAPATRLGLRAVPRRDGSTRTHHHRRHRMPVLSAADPAAAVGGPRRGCRRSSPRAASDPRGAERHLEAGARKVIISAPAKGEDRWMPTSCSA